MEDIVEHSKEALESVSIVPTNSSVSSSGNLLQTDSKEIQSQSGNTEISGILDLSYQKLVSLPHLPGNLLCVLNISNNHLETLPAEICKLSKLTSLTVCHNKLKELPDNIGDLNHLAIFKASSNKLQSIPVSFSKLNLLRELDLSKNNISRVPDVLQVGCKSLQYINLAHNHLECWPYAPASVHSLISVFLSNNKLTALPLWLFDGRAFLLRSVDISVNPISCKDHRNLASNPAGRFSGHLAQLNMSDCMLSQADLEFLNRFETLTHLRIGNSHDKDRQTQSNLIRQIDVGALKCRKNLIELSLRNVALTDLPDDVGYLENLEILDCRENLIMMLADSISKLHRLRVLLLSGNELCLLPDNFGDLIDLIELRLDRNHISSLPESFQNLKNLLWLDLYENELQVFPEQLENLIGNFKGLDLEHNFFDVSSVFEEDIDWLNKTKYEEMLDEMRNHFCISNDHDTAVFRSQYRSRGSLQPVLKHSDSEDIESYSDGSLENSAKCFEKHSLDSDNCSSPESQIPTFEEEETWEEKHSDSDDFDPIERPPVPSALRSSVALNRQRRTIEIPEHVFKSYSFCPSDIHAPSTRVKKAAEVVFPPEEGQFDDA